MVTDGRAEIILLLHIQTDRQVILDPGGTNWPVSPTQVNQEIEGEGRQRHTERGWNSEHRRPGYQKIKDECILEKIIEKELS